MLMVLWRGRVYVHDPPCNILLALARHITIGDPPRTLMRGGPYLIRAYLFFHHQDRTKPEIARERFRLIKEPWATLEPRRSPHHTYVRVYILCMAIQSPRKCLQLATAR